MDDLEKIIDGLLKRHSFHGIHPNFPKIYNYESDNSI